LFGAVLAKHWGSVWFTFSGIDVLTLEAVRAHALAVRIERHGVSADDLWERRKAERMQGRLDLLEDIAAGSERARSGLLRQALAMRYRSIVGVDPAKRDTFRRALSNLENGQTVSDVVDLLRDDQLNGCSSESGVDSD
jgi:hypothetical protein